MFARQKAHLPPPIHGVVESTNVFHTYVENIDRLATCYGVIHADEDMKLEALLRSAGGRDAAINDNFLNNLRRNDNKAKYEFHRDEARSVAIRVCFP
jgi:hypothetical protein